ncbi:MAG: MCE family protein [Gemmatimonadetes bacterium]|jgi:phospholipid/cholesterol/gamma-HCH transport system substrate-binding protein|nr:MCE family protein [Gemmatimonadota bacterium]MBT5142029.1 MCE family protein [Gemmatimonadota bacterium]MBT5589681.1 MCE family protein [Gemmatimonadota bacterium]MBT5964142.1 MCE family protein [Gemmatimonadota bacterium]MBT6627274.1 MCE family protein [Gemmatimonadota bacterium]
MADGGTRRLHESSLGQVLVGLFVLIVCGGFGWLLIELRSGPERYALIAEFDTMGNISEATKVKLRGFTVGRVDGIQFAPDPDPGEPYFLVEIGVEKGVPVPQGTIAEIRGSGLVGEAYVELLAPAEPTTGALAPGSHLTGRSDASMKTLITSLTEAATKLGGAGAALRDAQFGDKMARLNDDVSRLVDQMTLVSGSADTLLRASHTLVTQLQPTLQHSLDGLDQSLAHVTLLLSRSDTLLAESDDDIRKTLRALLQVAEHLDHVLGRIDTLTASKQGQIDSTLSNLHETSESIRALSARPLRVFSGTGEGQVLRDEFDVLTGSANDADTLTTAEAEVSDP